MPTESFFRADNNATIFSVTVPRYYGEHDLSAAFCYLKVRFADGTIDKSLLSTDFDGDTVTVACTISARMQRVEGVAKYQLSFECDDFIVQSSIIDVYIENALADAIEESYDFPEAANQMQELIQESLGYLNETVPMLESVSVGLSEQAIEKPTVITQKVTRLDENESELASINLDANGNVKVAAESFSVNNGEAVTAQSILHIDLCRLALESKLVTGRFYRITDYTAVVDSEIATSAGHSFDIIVKAISPDKISENAVAAPHDGETYFSGSDLGAWEIKYSLFDYVDKYDWADTESGKGVIYYMKDEFGNECPYDFKNIKFKRTTASDEQYYAYTFSSLDGAQLSAVIAGTAQIYDASVYNPSLDHTDVAYGNVIKPLFDESGGGTYSLNDIVILEDYGDCCHGNHFGFNCHDITAGRDFMENRFANGCHHITFGNSCDNNIFGSGLWNASFGNDCRYNVFGDDCANISVGDEVISCKFGNSVANVNCTNGQNAVYYVTVADGVKGASSSSRLEIYYEDVEYSEHIPYYIEKDDDGRIIMSWSISPYETDYVFKADPSVAEWTVGERFFVSQAEKTIWNGKQDAIDSAHKLSGDLVDDTSTTHKFVTAAEKATWNGKQNALTFDDAPTSGSANPVKSGGVYSELALKMPLSTKYAANLSLTINSSNYVVTAQLKDQDGNNIGNAQTIDLPLESVVVNGSYNSLTKQVILTLQNGNTIAFSVADLISGLQSEITAQNKLSADLVDDTNQTNKFVTSAEKAQIATNASNITFLQSSKANVTDVLPNSREVAGISLSSDISVSALLNALFTITEVQV